MTGACENLIAGSVLVLIWSRRTSLAMSANRASLLQSFRIQMRYVMNLAWVDME